MTTRERFFMGLAFSLMAFTLGGCKKYDTCNKGVRRLALSKTEYNSVSAVAVNQHCKETHGDEWANVLREGDTIRLTGFLEEITDEQYRDECYGDMANKNGYLYEYPWRWESGSRVLLLYADTVHYVSPQLSGRRVYIIARIGTYTAQNQKTLLFVPFYLDTLPDNI